MPQNERQYGITERKFSSYENLLHRYILASYRSRNKGLLYGQLGSAIILYSIARNPRFSAVEPTADDLLDKALKDLPDNLPIGLATGLTGYCWGVEYLTYKQYIECIPNEVCESLILNIQKFNPLYLDYSLKEGLWGLLHYMVLHLANIGSRKQIKTLSRHLMHCFRKMLCTATRKRLNHNARACYCDKYTQGKMSEGYAQIFKDKNWL